MSARTGKVILGGDLHLRATAPISRVDDYLSAQREKLRVLLRHANLTDALLLAGDLFHTARTAEHIVGMLLSLLRRFDKMPVLIAPGNHDLPAHSMRNLHDSSLGLLDASWHAFVRDHYSITDECEVVIAHWGLPIATVKEKVEQYNPKILIWHTMTWSGRLPWPGCSDLSATALLREFPSVDLMLTGHNHKQFMVESDGRFLVNPGSMMRMTADQMKHKPAYYVYDYENHEIERVPFHIEADVLVRRHLDDKLSQDARLAAFVEKIGSNSGLTLDYEENLRRAIMENGVREPVQRRVWEAFEGERNE